MISSRPAREGECTVSTARFEWHLKGPAPDFSDGVRFLEVDRMRNYVRTHPYARYLAERIRELS
jgi:hypothetical protein